VAHVVQSVIEAENGASRSPCCPPFLGFCSSPGRVRADNRSAAKDIDFLTIKDQAKSVREDVARIRNHPLVPKSIPIYGYVYDVKSGRLVEVPEAKSAASEPSSKTHAHARPS